MPYKEFKKCEINDKTSLWSCNPDVAGSSPGCIQRITNCQIFHASLLWFLFKKEAAERNLLSNSTVCIINNMRCSDKRNPAHIVLTHLSLLPVSLMYFCPILCCDHCF